MPANLNAASSPTFTQYVVAILVATVLVLLSLFFLGPHLAAVFSAPLNP